MESVVAKPSDYTEEEIAAVIRDCGGYITAIAKTLDCKVQSIRAHIMNCAELRDIQHEMQEELLDDAERALAKAVRGERAWAVKYCLSRLGRKRGYGQKIEVEGTGTNSSRIVVYLPDDGRETRAPDGDSTTTGSAGSSPLQ